MSVLAISGLIEQLPSILLTSLLSAFFVFISLRWVFSKLIKPLSGLTTLGAKVAAGQSGFSRASKVVTAEAAEGILKSPNLAGLRLLASQIGFNIDEMIEEHGALETLTGISQVAQMIGIDLGEVLQKGLGGMAKGILGGKGEGSSEATW